jgi:Domain of unknown function (DUF4062)
MSRSITQYRVFIASPSGLDEERRAFRETLERHTACDAEPRGVTFHPVGWEDTIGGVGRPQEQINDDLKQCDYAIFVLHDRWGSPTGEKYTSGVEEEWKIAEDLYAATTIRNIGLFFKRVDERQMRDPGEQLKKVLAFRESIATAKRHLFRDYDATDEFCEHLRFHLAKWLRDHEGKATAPGLADVEGLAYAEQTRACEIRGSWV